jgi:hypothetical protein
MRTERAQLVLSLSYEAVARFRHLVPLPRTLTYRAPMVCENDSLTLRAIEISLEFDAVAYDAMFLTFAGTTPGKNRNPNLWLRRAMIGDILLFEGTRRKRLPDRSIRLHTQVRRPRKRHEPRIKMRGSEEKDMIRRNIGTVLVAAAIIVILFVAFILALAQDKLPELALDLTVYLFATTLAVFVVGRVLAWREERRWLAAKEWLYMILLEAIDDLLKELLPATVPQEGVETDEDIPVYEVAGERIHFGETVAYSPLQLLVGPGEKDLQSHINWYASELGPPRYADLARAALSEAREQVRDMLATSGQLLEADITSMMSWPLLVSY